jgi:hypothetical protein
MATGTTYDEWGLSTGIDGASYEVWRRHTAAYRERIGELERDLALAESRIEQRQRQLVAAGVMDPELGP